MTLTSPLLGHHCSEVGDAGVLRLWHGEWLNTKLEPRPPRGQESGEGLALRRTSRRYRSILPAVKTDYCDKIIQVRTAETLESRVVTSPAAAASSRLPPSARQTCRPSSRCSQRTSKSADYIIKRSEEQCELQCGPDELPGWRRACLS